MRRKQGSQAPVKPVAAAPLISRRLAKPHPLIEQTRLALEHAKANDYCRLVPKGPCLAIAVSKDSLGRALRLMDGIVKSLQASGHAVLLTSEGRDGKPSTNLVVDGQEFTLSLFETARRFPQDIPPGKRKPHTYYPSLVYKPSGMLTLEIGGPYSFEHRWADGSHERLEEAVKDFSTVLRELATKKRENAEQQERERIAREEAARRAAELQRLREVEERRVQAFVNAAGEWQQSDLLKRFVQHLRQAVAQHESTPEFAEWLEWAESQAQRIDPTATILQRAAAGQYPVHVEEPKATRYW